MHRGAQDEIAPLVFSLAGSWSYDCLKGGRHLEGVQEGDTREVAGHQRGYLVLESHEGTQNHRHNLKETMSVTR